jgi:hypothetical protein
MLRPLAGRQISYPSDIIAWATSVNDEMIKAGVYNKENLINRLATFPVPEEAPNPEMYGNDEIKPVGFEEAPACPTADVSFVPAVTDTFVVFRINSKDPPKDTLQTCLGDNYSQLWSSYEQNLRTLDATRFPYAQIRVQTRRFLQNFENEILETLDIAQPALDEARKKLEELGFKDKIIEVPVLLRKVGNQVVGLTADSINMLVLAQDNSCRCLVPKPFGPTAKGQYVYEVYLEKMLKQLGVDYKILPDDAFHVQDGEIHCGTNQLPMPLKEERCKWWVIRPKQAKMPTPLPKKPEKKKPVQEHSFNVKLTLPIGDHKKEQIKVDSLAKNPIDITIRSETKENDMSAIITLDDLVKIAPGRETTLSSHDIILRAPSLKKWRDPLKIKDIQRISLAKVTRYEPEPLPVHEEEAVASGACRSCGCTQFKPLGPGIVKRNKCTCGHHISDHPGAS